MDELILAQTGENFSVAQRHASMRAIVAAKHENIVQ